jgi:hypothetical protein
MDPIAEFHTLADDLFVWSGYDPACKVDCSGTALLTAEGLVLIDAPMLSPAAIEELIDGRKPLGILLTSGNHQRVSLEWKKRLDIPIWAPRLAQEEVIADEWFDHDSRLFGEISVTVLPGSGPGEVFFLKDRTAVVGDALIHLDGLMLLPDKYCTAPRELPHALSRLVEAAPERICFAHGLPIVNRATARVRALLNE